MWEAIAFQVYTRVMRIYTEYFKIFVKICLCTTIGFCRGQSRRLLLENVMWSFRTTKAIETSEKGWPAQVRIPVHNARFSKPTPLKNRCPKLFKRLRSKNRKILGTRNGISETPKRFQTALNSVGRVRCVINENQEFGDQLVG